MDSEYIRYMTSAKMGGAGYSVDAILVDLPSGSGQVLHGPLLTRALETTLLM